MWKDKKPGKWALLALLFLLALIGFLIFSGLKAQAERFLHIREIKTPGGLSIWAVEDKTLPIIAVQFAFLDAGAARDPAARQGLARLLSNTMDEGAGDLDAQAFQKKLSDHSITLLFNAGRDSFGGSLLTLSRHQDVAFDLLKLAIQSPRFDEEAVARMKDANLVRIRSSLSEPDWIAARIVNDRAFAGHPYAQNTGGTISGLGAITPDDLRAFMKDNLTRDRLLITAAGDIDAQKLASAMDTAFGALPAKAAQGPIADSALPGTAQSYAFHLPIPQTYISMILPGIDGKDEDHYAYQVMNNILGGAGFGSRLMEEVREKNGLTYGIFSDTQDLRHADVFTIATSTKTQSAESVLSIITKEMIKMKNGAVSADELSHAKSYITGSLPLALTSTEEIASLLLSMRMQERPIDYLDHFAQKINAVDADDITRAAKRALDERRMTTVLVGDTTALKDVTIIKELPNVQ
jgi:zinc protease